MKKLLALLLVLIMVFAFAACGENTDTPVDDNSEISQTENQGGELFDIDDSKIVVTEGLGVDISIIPNSLKKALGNKERYQAALETPIAYTDTQATFKIYMKDATKEDFETLISYYETAFGKEAIEDMTNSYMMELDFGNLTITFSESIGQITVYAGIK